MMFISIHPYPVRKTFIIIAGLICLFAASCFADSLFLSVDSIPHDRQMIRIRPVLFTKSGVREHNISLAIVNPWVEGVESSPVVNRKGKAVALDQKIQAHGAKNIRHVIGKRTAISHKTHASRHWTIDSGAHVLDLTIIWTACQIDGLGTQTYIPFYAYSGGRKYPLATAPLYSKDSSSHCESHSSR